jgi:hypothetical protein
VGAHKKLSNMPVQEVQKKDVKEKPGIGLLRNVVA